MTADETGDQQPSEMEFQWFAHQTAGARGHQERGPGGWQLLIGFAVGALFFFVGWLHIALIVFGITAVLAAIALLKPAWFRAVQQCLVAAGRWAGLVVGVLLLTPTFYICFTLARLFSWIRGHDPLRLKRDDSSTYWHIADVDRRKVRWYASMFATERPDGKSSGLLAWAGLAVLSLLLAEGVLRLVGLGSPVLYVNDPIVGYYPLPQQKVYRLGNTITFNRYAMRAPDFELEKPPGTIRILMLGDSTLYGGSYMANEELYARRLEELLSAELATPVEVWNMGVNAWGPFHKAGFVEKNGNFDADLAIVCLPILDVYRLKHSVADTPLATFYLASRQPRFALSELCKLVRIKWRKFRKGPSQFNNRAPERATRGIEEYGRLARLLKDAGCEEVFFEVLPVRDLGLGLGAPPEQNAELKARLQQAVSAHADFNAPADIFSAHAQEPDDIYHDACHLNPTGHELYAEYLFNRLLETSDTLQGVKEQSGK